MNIKTFTIILLTLQTNTLICKWCKDWFPRKICGADLQTYDSLCHLRCAGVRFKENGECPDNCDDTPDPVCGSDGQTYWNKCKALLKKIFIRRKGRCESDESDENDHGCGGGNCHGGNLNGNCNGGNFSNCNGGNLNGNCHGGNFNRNCNGGNLNGNSGCGCSEQNSPCCGSNGVTYRNECVMKCHGVGKVYDSPCNSGYNMNYVGSQGHY